MVLGDTTAETMIILLYYNLVYNMIILLNKIYITNSNITIMIIIYETRFGYHQRKLGSNTSVLRTNRILRREMMQGGRSHNNT